MNIKKMVILIMYAMALLLIVLNPRTAPVIAIIWIAAVVWKKVRHTPVVTLQIHKKRK